MFGKKAQKVLIWPLISAIVAEFVLNIIQFLIEQKTLTWLAIKEGLISNLSWGLIVGIFVYLYLIMKNLYEWQEEIAKTYYKGFSTLLTNSKEPFENMEKMLMIAGKESPLRGVLLDFIVNSLASIGKNGFTIIDASVSDYVRYIKEVVPKSESRIIMTCVVRPYWFVVDEIPGVTLPPYINDKNQYGKGDHLKYFQKKSNQNIYQRYLVIDELMIAEMLLTAYIAKYFVANISIPDCPVCKNNKNICAFHNSSQWIQINNIDDIPEIYWFRKDVNENRGVNLLYTLVRNERRKKHIELDDRIYVENNLPLDIRFKFTNLENGLLKISWNNNAQKLAWIDIPSSDSHFDVNPMDGTKTPPTHKFYRRFRYVLKDELKNKIIQHLNLLKQLVEEQKKKQNTHSIFTAKVNEIPNQEIKALLANGDIKFIEIISTVIDSLISDLNSRSLEEIYNDLVNFYQNSTIPKVSYVVTYDLLHSDYPVRVSRWKFNWMVTGTRRRVL